MEGETRTKAKKMSTDQVRRLIAARVNNNHMFTRKYYDKKAAWRAIQEKAGLHEFTAEQVKIKWSNLTRKYKLLITPPTGGATENGEQTPEDWEHFNQMHEFMSTQHTINPPLVVNSCGVIVENSRNVPLEQQSILDEDTSEAGPSSSIQGSYSGSLESTAPGTSSEGMEKPEKLARKRNRFTQQEMFEHFVKESKRKRKEGQKFFSLLKCIAQAQNIEVPNYDSSSSESDLDA